MKTVDMKTTLFRGNLYRSIDVAGSGLTAQRMKMDAVSSNIANVGTTRVDGGGPYLRRQVLMTPDPRQTFARSMERAMLRLDTPETGHISNTRAIGGRKESIPLVGAREKEIPNIRKNVVYDPSHPDADADGYVVYPDVNIVEEMVDLMVASRAFDADVTVINAAKSMITKSLEI